jgi:hypothetical protein
MYRFLEVVAQLEDKVGLEHWLTIEDIHLTVILNSKYVKMAVMEAMRTIACSHKATGLQSQMLCGLDVPKLQAH